MAQFLSAINLHNINRDTHYPLHLLCSFAATDLPQAHVKMPSSCHQLLLNSTGTFNTITEIFLLLELHYFSLCARVFVKDISASIVAACVHISSSEAFHMSCV